MKRSFFKIGLSFLLWVVVKPGTAQPIIFSDTFAYNTSNVPTGWSVVSLNDAGPSPTQSQANWTMTPDGTGASGFYWENRPAIHSFTASTGAIIFNSDFLDNGGTGNSCDPAATSCVPHEGVIISPRINTQGIPHVSVRFHQYFRGLATETFLEVSDDSINWHPFPVNMELSGRPFGGETSPEDIQQVNITPIAANKPNVWIRFRFKGEYYFWIIDDLVVFAGWDRDLGITEIISPNKDIDACLRDDGDQITVRIHNYGSVPDSNFLVNYQIPGITFFSDTFDAVLPPNESAVFTFSQPFFPDSAYSLGVFLGDPTFPIFDNNPANNNLFCEYVPVCCTETDAIGGSYVCNQVIVKFSPSASPALRAAIRDSFDIPPALIDSCRCNEFELWDMQFPNKFQNDTITNVNEGISLIKIRPGVKDAGRNYLDDVNPPVDSAGTGPPYRAPEDSNATKRVVVGVIDTGIDFSHDSVENNFWVNPAETANIYASDADSNCYLQDNLGMNFLAHDQAPQDDNSHGNHVGGTIINALPEDLRIELQAIKAQAKNGKGTLFDMICAVYYAVDEDVDLINMSVGYMGELSSMLDTAVFDAEAADILIIASAGNESLDNEMFYHWPSGFSQYWDSAQAVVISRNVISVAAYDTMADQLAGFSNFGAGKVDIAAPGVDIYSTGLGENQMTFKSGTSMAAALVSRSVALYVGCNPDASWDEIKGFLLDSAQVKPSLNNLVGGARFLDTNDSLYINCGGASQLNSNVFPAKVNLFPNPNHGEFTLEILDANSPEILVDVLNSIGQMIDRQTIRMAAPSSRHLLNLGKLPSGIYYIRLTLGERQKVIKMGVEW
ncbi:MAG: S8 family serine peptidase [Bacteroidia bacterium]